MSVKKKEASLLAPFRVLDLTDEKGYLCGKILGDLGADVIKIEKPGGDPGRKCGPFFKDQADPEKSLLWFAYNNNKRGITLNIETEDGKDIFRRLVKSADFVLESFAPGYLDKLGLGYSELSKVNPRTILTSITPFGQSGPYKDYKVSDLVAEAMGGFLFVLGDPDRPPVRISLPQSYCHASAEAAVGTMIAHYHRERTGEGQHVDVSIQSSWYLSLVNIPLFWEANRMVLHRAGAFTVGRLVKGEGHRAIWPCKDGYLVFVAYGGQTGAPSNRALVEWMDSKGMAPDYLKEVDWNNYDLATTPPETLGKFGEAFGKFFQTITEREFYEDGFKRGIMGYHICDVKDIVEDNHLAQRDFWTSVEHPELGDSITYPGAFAKLTETPLKLRRRAPLIGEHNEEIYEREMGLSKGKRAELQQRGVI